MLHISACQIKINEGDGWIKGAAILRSSGSHDVITFIMPDGAPCKAKVVADYVLRPEFGAISISLGW